MCTAVAQPKQARRIVHHLVDRCMVASDVVHQREVKVPTVGLGDVVVRHLVGRTPAAGGHRGDAFFRWRLVVRRISHDEELVPTADDVLAELDKFCRFGVGRLLGEDLAADIWIAQAHPLPVDR